MEKTLDDVRQLLFQIEIGLIAGDGFTARHNIRRVILILRGLSAESQFISDERKEQYKHDD